MEYELAHINDFDRYEGGQMADSEAEAFRLRLLTDQDLAAEHQLYLTLSSGIRGFHRKRLKNLLNGFEKAYQHPDAEPEFRRSSNGAWKWALAASVSILLAISILTWKYAQPSASWSDMYVEDPGLSVLMSKPDPKNAQYNQAMNYYRQGDFENAFSSLPNNNSDTVLFYRGLFALKQDNPVLAQEYLRPVRRNQRSEFKQKADYYTAMAMWKSGNKAEAKVIFTEIADQPEHPFNESAQMILKDANF